MTKTMSEERKLGRKQLKCGRKVNGEAFAKSTRDSPIFFKTPNLFKGKYPKKANCNSILTVPKGTKLNMVFAVMDIDKKRKRGGKKKCRDFLSIKAGNKKKTYCGPIENASKVRVMGPWGKDRKIQLTFRSNNDKYRGKGALIFLYNDNSEDSMDAPTTARTTTCAKIPVWMESNRIVGGQDAQAPIPWQVFVHVEDGKETYRCGGTILDENTILTAAHCFWPEDNIDDYIVAGVTVIDYADEIRVKKVINHPNYNSKTNDNDIAILKLESPLTFNENVKPACLPDSSFTPGHEQSAFVSGWGDMEYDTSTETKTLQFVKVQLLSNCLSNHLNGIITSNMICAGYEDGGKDACSGDSGGPLVVSGTDDSAIVVGVVSYGFECALADYPGVYAKVQNYLPWIKNNMN